MMNGSTCTYRSTLSGQGDDCKAEQSRNKLLIVVTWPGATIAPLDSFVCSGASQLRFGTVSVPVDGTSPCLLEGCRSPLLVQVQYKFTCTVVVCTRVPVWSNSSANWACAVAFQ